VTPLDGDQNPPRKGLQLMLKRVDTRDQGPDPADFGIVDNDVDEITSVVSVHGELDLTTAPKLKWMLHDLLDAGRSRQVVDLTETTFMDSTALGVLVGVNRSLGEGARLAIVCSRPNVLKIFELSGMDGVFTIVPTLDEALEYARGRAAKAS
jgi:anti-sigma B factor antagonist